MAEPFSVAASSFAVVGLADVVIRAGNQVYQFLNAIKDAPAEVKKLQLSIHDNIALAENSKAYWEEARQLVALPNAAAITPLSKTLPQFKSALEALKRELSVLLILTKRYKGVPNIWGRVKFVFDDRKIQRSLQRLEALKSNLVIALVLVGKQQDLVSQTGFEQNIQEALRQMKVSTESKIHEVGRQIEEFRKGAGSGQVSLEDASSRLNRQTDVVRKDIVKTNQNILQQHKKTRVQLTQETTNAVNIICAKLDNLSRELVRAETSAKSSGRKIRFNGNSREDVLCPLLLLRPEFQRAISGMLSRQSELFSPQDLYWLQSEFESLVVSATQEVAAVSHGSTATSFDDWTYPQGVSSFLARDAPQGTLISKKRFTNDFILANKGTELNAKADKKGRRLGSRSFSFELPIGTLQIIIPRLTVTSPAVPKPGKPREVGFSFLPRSGICSTSLRGYFVNATNVQPKPCLYTQLNAFNITPQDESLVHLFCNGTLEEIDSAFRLGKMSPYDVSEYGVNHCLCLSACAGRIDVLQYLDSNGIGILSFKDGWSVFRGLLLMIGFCALCERDEEDVLEKMDINYRILEYLTEKDDVIDIPINPDWISVIEGLESSDFSDSIVSMIRHLFKALKENEYDFEQDSAGLNSLAKELVGCGRLSVELVRIKLECGANAHAICRAYDMFRIAMCWCIEESYREFLEQKFCLLIRAGVDVNFVDVTGKTPSDVARERGYWDEWCRALESNKLKIDEVLAMDENRREHSGPK
ncbi:hypothetical protein GJ744_011942 [Endocarpon pusillum]|uniref:Fungal N-terminal domain-containing protein n=1 Tax=Endocarpon pusillum TaxID=364733 RepID=A0A8H7ASQ0_9EURO|nr:hypothetical protein GJ744_011942 [Endocarpon pusillum]